MGVNQVFKQGRTEKASEIIGDSGLGTTNKRKGPIVDNKDSSRFAALDLEGLSREFAEGFEGIGNIHSDVSDSETLQKQGSENMDEMINTALDNYERRKKQNFLFDRMKAVSSETKRINANLDMKKS